MFTKYFTVAAVKSGKLVFLSKAGFDLLVKLMQRLEKLIFC